MQGVHIIEIPVEDGLGGAAQEEVSVVDSEEAASVAAEPEENGDFQRLCPIFYLWDTVIFFFIG